MRQHTVLDDDLNLLYVRAKLSKVDFNLDWAKLEFRDPSRCGTIFDLSKTPYNSWHITPVAYERTPKTQIYSKYFVNCVKGF